MRITIELETPGDPTTIFRLIVGERTVAERLVAVQAHLLVGEILETIALPTKPPGRFSNSALATTNEAFADLVRRDVMA